jgi:UDP-glucuronate 4-epimerase
VSIIITGGAGFIGSNLSEKLLSSSKQVVVIDNFDTFYDPEIKRRNVETALSNDNYELVDGDIRSTKDLDRCLELAGGRQQVEGVIHLAARAGVRASIADPILAADINVRGLVDVLEFVKNNELPKFVFASSSSVYGERGNQLLVETDPTDHPISPYAATKKSGENICWTYNHLNHFPISCLRFFTVYGPRQRPEMAIHFFTRLIDEGEEIPVFGDGSAQRDFTFVEDTIHGIIQSFEHADGFNIYNLGRGEAVTLSEIIEAIESALGKKARINRLESQPGDVSSTIADITRAQKDIGYAPQTPFAQGVKRFVEWYSEARNPERGTRSV